MNRLLLPLTSGSAIGSGRVSTKRVRSTPSLRSPLTEHRAQIGQLRHQGKIHLGFAGKSL
jgi:hypothetical protein